MLVYTCFCALRQGACQARTSGGYSGVFRQELGEVPPFIGFPRTSQPAWHNRGA